MDKYRIYGKVGEGTHSQVCKGRRKMSMEYVAIKKVDKSRIDNVIQEIKVGSSQIPASRDGWAEVAIIMSFELISNRPMVWFTVLATNLRVKIERCPRT